MNGQNANYTFITAVLNPAGLAVDSSHLYWANSLFNGGTIGRANLDGQNANNSFITGASGPVGIAVDPGNIYWANNTSGTIGRADLNGQNANQSFIPGAAQNLQGVAVDPS